MNSLRKQTFALIFIGIFYGSIQKTQEDVRHNREMQTLHQRIQQLLTIPSSPELNIIPNFDESILFLEKNLDNIASYDVNYPLITRITQGWSYGKLTKLVDEAKFLAIENDDDWVTMHHINMAADNMCKGLKSDMFDVIKNKNMYATAIHEAGHAISYAYNNNGHRIIHSVTIETRLKSIDNADKASGGFVHPLRQSLLNIDEIDVQNDMISAFAGGVATQMFNLYPDVPQNMLTNDAKILEFSNTFNLITDIKIIKDNARWIINRAHANLSEDDITKKINQTIIVFYKIAYLFISEHKDEVEKLANFLMEKRSISGDDLYDLLNINKPLYDFEQGPQPEKFIQKYPLA